MKTVPQTVRLTVFEIRRNFFSVFFPQNLTFKPTFPL